MKPDDIANAITQALVQGGSLWMISTIVAFLPALWTMTLMLHLGRPYVLRTLRRCGLRLGADVWWMSYLLMRDAVLLITFALSWIFFNPNIVAGSALPITGPLAALALLLALAVKMSRRVDDDVAAYRLAKSPSISLRPPSIWKRNDGPRCRNENLCTLPSAKFRRHKAGPPRGQRYRSCFCKGGRPRSIPPVRLR